MSASDQISLAPDPVHLPDTVYLHPNEDGEWVTTFIAPAPGRDAVVIRSTCGEPAVVADAPALTGAAATRVADLSYALNLAVGVLDGFTALKRREANSPDKYGLIPRDLTQPQAGATLGWGYSRSAQVIMLLGEAPASLWDGMLGWFAPDADPEVFGTPYLMSYGDTNCGWRLHQVGIDAATGETAAWDDADAVRRLASECGTDPELRLTMAALEDAHAVASSARLHEFRLQTLDAREHFAAKAKQIRPRLVGGMIDDARRATGVGWQARGAEHYLTPYQVFGYHQGQSGPKGVYAAASVQFEVTRGFNESTVETFATTLQGLLDARSLGQVVRVSDAGVEHVFVTLDPAGIQRFPAAFGLTDSATYRLMPSSPVAQPTRRPARANA